MFVRTISLFACLAILSARIAYADKVSVLNGVAQDHFVWPKKLFVLDPSKFVDVMIDLPHSWEVTGPLKTRSVYYVDLNEDGVKEMIVVMGRDGQQEDMGIFQLQGGKWVDIGDFANGCSFCSKWNGYYQLEDGGYGGGQVHSRSLLRFIRGRYRDVRNEVYEGDRLDTVDYNRAGLGD
jgi:hypothetical protein